MKKLTEFSLEILKTKSKEIAKLKLNDTNSCLTKEEFELLLNTGEPQAQLIAFERALEHNIPFDAALQNLAGISFLFGFYLAQKLQNEKI